MLHAVLANTGQNQATLTVVFIVGGVLVIAGVAAMVAVRVSRKKNAAAGTFAADAGKADKPADK